jgi:hypothetical protein
MEMPQIQVNTAATVVLLTRLEFLDLFELELEGVLPGSRLCLLAEKNCWGTKVANQSQSAPR